jgi:hypothetical protein
MAIVSKPIWSPDPVTSLPSCTTIEFTVIPGVFADSGIIVEYVLHSAQAEYLAGTKPPGLSDDEKNGSDPTTPDLEPNKRGRALLVDRYRGARFNEPFQITRMLCLSKTPGGTPGLSSITVTVSDMQSNEVPTDPFVQTAMIRV